MHNRIQRIAITPGEPAGIGPDLLIHLSRQENLHELVVIADPDLLSTRAQQLGLKLQIKPFNSRSEAKPSPAGQVTILPVKLNRPAQAGQLDPSNAKYVLECLDRAVDGCLSGQFDALLTGPVHKGVINEAGIPFTGHTEYLAEKTNTPQVVMMLATQGLRVALATTHLPLSEVASRITSTHLERIIRILHAELTRHFGLLHPHITVCGLNPHAGEQGHMGHEEISIMRPVLEQLTQQGMQLEGPLPADTVFVPYRLAKTDCVLAMYHDQGLPVLKHMGFGQAVNITLGLPFIRTSVDHGTALDRAGTGDIDSGSLRAALSQATEMASLKSDSAYVTSST